MKAAHLRLIFQAGTLMEHHCPREKVLRHSQPNRWLVPRGHEDSSSARACSADLWFQRSASAEMIMQAAPWAPSTTIKVIRGAPPLHIQPYGETVDRWVFNCRSVDPSPQRGPGSLSMQLVTRIQYRKKHFRFFLHTFLISGWALTYHSRAAISLSMWFPPWTWLGLARGLCAEPLGRAGNRYRIDSPSPAQILPSSVI